MRGMNVRLVTDRFAILREHERLLMICISTVLVMAGQGVVGPVLPLFAKQFGVSTAVIGLTLSVYALARLLLNVPLGYLADRRGRRVLLVGGPLFTALGMVGSGFAQSIVQLMAWRFIAGVGSAMYMTGAMIYLVDISTPATRARFIGTNQGALFLGVTVGPGVGGLLAEWLGLRAPFYVVGVTALIATMYAYWRLPETLVAHTGQHTASRGETWHALSPMLRSRGFMAVSLVAMAIFLTRTGGRQTLMPLIGVERLDMSPAALGAVFMGMAFIALIVITPSAIAADRWGRRAVILPSGLLTCVGLVCYAVAGSYATFMLASLVTALGSEMAGPAPAAYVADIAPPQVRGLALGLYRTVGDLGFAIGPPLLGLLADRTSLGWAMVANGVLIAMASITFALVAPNAGPQRERVPLPTERRAEAAG